MRFTSIDLSPDGEVASISTISGHEWADAVKAVWARHFGVDVMAKYEGSKRDKAEDRKQAKKRGVTLKSWEGSAADRKMDAAAKSKRKEK